MEFQYHHNGCLDSTARTLIQLLRSDPVPGQFWPWKSPGKVALG